MGAITILGGIFGRCFRINAARQARSHLLPRGTTAISFAPASSGETTAMQPSSTLKCSHVRRSETLSAFWSSRTPVRLFFRSSRKVQKAISLIWLRPWFIRSSSLSASLLNLDCRCLISLCCSPVRFFPNAQALHPLARLEEILGTVCPLCVRSDLP